MASHDYKFESVIGSARVHSVDITREPVRVESQDDEIRVSFGIMKSSVALPVSYILENREAFEKLASYLEQVFFDEDVRGGAGE